MSKIGIGVTVPNVDAKWNGQHIVHKKNISYNWSQCSIARDKNSLIKQLYDDGAEYLFIFDDDCFPIKQGWEYFFIDASQRTGCEHFIVGNDKHLNHIGGDNGLSYFQKGTGCMLFLTRKAIETVGYLNNKYGKYGYEHAAYSARIHKAKLTPSWYTSVDGWEEYIYSWDLDKENADKHNFKKVQQFTEEEKTKFISENEYQFRKEMRSKKLYYSDELTVRPPDHKIRVAYFSVVDDGSNYYRIQGVLPFIRHENIELVDISKLDWYTWATYTGFDILIIPRPYDQSMFEIIQMATVMNIWTILDYDDDCLNIPDHHPSYDLYQENRTNILSCIKAADEIWVTTKSIRETFYPFNHNIHVIPNAHNDYIFPVEQRKKFNYNNKKVVYRGGKTHRIDIKNATEALVKAAKENPKWTFLYLGVADNSEFYEDNKGNENVTLTNGIPCVQYLNNLYDFNCPVMINPLDTHKLNKSKSNISWIEGTYAGSAFFGNKGLPEFNHHFILPFSLFNKGIKEEHISTMRKSQEESWAYIEENLLLSKINRLRVERLLTW
jgi:hypothetical protein